MRHVLLISAAMALLGMAPLYAQLEDNLCPGGDAGCSDDFLGITFEVASPQGTDLVEITGDNCFAYGAFEAGTRIGSVLTMATVSDSVQGYSLAVAHDESLLSITDDDLIVDNTDTAANEGGFPFRNNKVVSGGYIVAEVLDISGGGALLPPVAGDDVNTLLRAYYTLNAEPPAEGTMLRYSSGNLSAEGSPPVAVVVTNAGNSLSPNGVTNAIILASCDVQPDPEICDNQIDDNGDGLVDCADPECADFTACQAEVCDNQIDDNGDGLVDCADPECADASNCVSGDCPQGDLLFFGSEATETDVELTGSLPVTVPISGRHGNNLLGIQLGVAIQAGSGTQSWTFSGDVGSTKEDGSQVIVSLIYAEEGGADVTPGAGNAASAATEAPVTNIERGAALLPLVRSGTGSDLGDFLSFELNPDILPSGATGGFTIGYVSDLDVVDTIPATPAEDCPANEFFLATVDEADEGSAFLRGDADGNGSHNVVDVVIMLQVLAGSRSAPFPNCLDILDSNGDGSLDVTDATFLLDFVILRDAPVLAAPYPNCAPTGTSCTESNCTQ